MKCRLTMIVLVLVTLITAPAWGTTYPVTDTFSGSGALSANWTNTTAGAVLSFKPVPLVQASGKVVPGASSPPTTYPWGLAIYTAVSFNADQYSQVKFVAHSTAGSTTGPCVQMSLSGGGYCWEVDNLHVNGFSNGASAGSIGIICPAVASGDTVKLSVAGTTLTCLDVTTGLSASGPGLTGFPAAGNPAVMVDTRNSSVYALASFQADCAPSCNGGPAPAAIPTFSPGAGTYGSAQTVTINDTTSGASIYYTTNGTAPLTHVTSYTHFYSGPIAVSTSQVVQAIATKTGDATSGIGSAVYTISATVATPAFSPGAGTYTSPQTVTISDATTGATIYYTTDGSIPTTGSTVYSTPITVSTSETVKALGVLSGYANSAIGSAAYVISGATVATPTFSPGAGSYSTPQTVTISDATAGATIYYTTDGSTPTTGSPVYSSPITVSVSERVKALGVKSGYTNSAIGSAAYTITGKTLTSIAISPQGGVLQPGSTTLPFTVQCNYSDSSHDTCAAAGGATWSVSRPTVSSISTSGVFTESTPPAWQASHAYALGALVTDTNGYIEQAAVAGTSGASITWPTPGGTDSEGGAFVENNYWNDRDHSPCPPCGFLDGGVSWNLVGTTADQSYAVVTAAGLSDKADVYRQIPGDTWYEYPTPDFHNYKNIVKNLYLPLDVAVGSKVTAGVGFVINSANTGRGQPLQATCNWTSSDPSVATVDRHGQVTGVSPGSVTITCGRAGNGNFSTTSNAGGWVSPGDTVALTVVNGGTGNTTWYVRPDGGTLYSSTNTSGQCSGKTDAPYPGSGTNGNCAAGSIRYLWADGNTTYQMKWVINGGDTVIVAQNAAGYNTGLDNYPGTWSPVNCRGTEGGCNMPTIPSGTASQHTKILGKNYASCHADSAKTRLNVSWGASTAFDVRDSQFVDIACFEVTDEAACATNTNYTNTCHNSTTLSYGAYGIRESALTSYVNYTDLFIHGLGEEGITGATGVGVVANYVHLRAMPSNGGINMDDVPWGNQNISVAGGFTMTNSTTEFSGCVEEYPVTHNYPYIECRDQPTGALGDGLGTASTTGDWYFDHDIWQYNYQDGLDLAHSGMQNLTVTNSLSQGNEGQAFKIGSADNVIFQNNIAMANCFRLGELIGDEPSSALTPGGGPPGLLYSLCRANGNISFHFTNVGTFAIQDNTIVETSDADTPVSVGCEAGWDFCTNANAQFQNNLTMGYLDLLSDSGAQIPALFYLGNPDLQNQSNFTSTDMPSLNGWKTRNHNLFYNVRSGWCPTPLQTGETCDTADPLFTGEPASPISHEYDLDNFNFDPSSSSPAIGAGIAIPGITTDYTGATRPNPPSIGAIE